MISWRDDRMGGGGDPFEGDDRLSSRLRDLDDRLTQVFATDLDDHERQAVFVGSVARRVHDERTMRDPAARPDDRPQPDLTPVATPVMWVPFCPGQISMKTWAVTLSCALVVAVLMVVAGLGLHASPKNGAASTDGLEKPDLRFAIMDTTDLVPFWLAVEEHYFQDAGFTFENFRDVVRVASGSEAVAKLTKNEVDIAYSTYTPFVAADDRDADVKLIAGASSAAPGSCVVVAAPNSRIKSIKDMPGARVAITAKDTISQLLVMSALKAAGVDWTQIRWIEVPFKDMAEKLAVGEVDAAFMTEPVLSDAKKTVGAIPIFDTAPANSPTAEIPTAGFGANAEFIRKYPKTIAAFQRVMARATAEARADRNRVNQLLQKAAVVDAETAKAATLLTFNSALDAAAIQRVTDLMLEFGMVHRKVDAAELIAR